jgi:hypothetical protein
MKGGCLCSFTLKPYVAEFLKIFRDAGGGTMLCIILTGEYYTRRVSRTERAGSKDTRQ